jgi:hypothetical protein
LRCIATVRKQQNASHLSEPGAAILAIEKVEKGVHNPTSSFVLNYRGFDTHEVTWITVPPRPIIAACSNMLRYLGRRSRPQHWDCPTLELAALRSKEFDQPTGPWSDTSGSSITTFVASRHPPE